MDGNARIGIFMGWQFMVGKCAMYNERGNTEDTNEVWVMNPSEQMISTGYYYNDVDVDFFDLTLCDDYCYNLKYNEDWNWLIKAWKKYQDWVTVFVKDLPSGKNYSTAIDTMGEIYEMYVQGVVNNDIKKSFRAVAIGVDWYNLENKVGNHATEVHK